MYNITIKNLRNTAITEPYQVRVDRASVLGNPFRMQNESDRDRVCIKYEDYFYDELRKPNSAFCAEIVRLATLWGHYQKLELFCWCAPKRCHAEVIKTYLEEALGRFDAKYRRIIEVIGVTGKVREYEVYALLCMDAQVYCAYTNMKPGDRITDVKGVAGGRTYSMFKE